ncbi:hypothetical protein BH10BAC3_BH10BAC3_17940 [soil metagenome]
MNKYSFKIRTILVGLLTTFATVSISVPAMANKKKIESALATIQPRVTFLGTENNSILFSVAIDSEEPVKFELSITDAEGEVIYKKAYEALKFVKVFKLVNEALSENPIGLSFYIKEKVSGVQHNFDASSTTEIVNEVAITKL